MRLAILTTHPIQYYAPLFRELTQDERICLKVFFSWGNVGNEKFDPGFGRTIAWDIPLLDGYEYEFLENSATKPGSDHFNGIVNPFIIRQIDGFKPDSILVFGWSYRSHLTVIRHYCGRLPVLFRGDSTLLDETGGIKSILKTLFLKWVYRHIHTALYVGSNNKLYFEKYGTKDLQLKWAPHAIDNKRFEDKDGRYTADANRLKAQMGIKSGAIVLLFAGKLEPKKDPMLLLDAFIDSGRSDMHLVFTGNGMLEEILKRKASEYRNIHFMDFQNQSKMPVIYRLADVLVLPSKGPGETWGLAVNEAFACGVPAIISNKVGCGTDLVIHDKTGYWFESGNKQMLTQIVQNLRSEALKEFSLNCSDLIGHWNLEVTAKKIAEALF